MKYLAIIGFLLGASGALFLPGCNSKKVEKKVQYTVSVGNVFIVCQKSTGSTLYDCVAPVMDIKFERIENATNVVVEVIPND